MGHIEYNFDNLGFPQGITDFANRMHREYRENGKMLFIKTKFQQHTGLQLLKFNSSSIINTVIILFKREDFNKVDLTDVEVIIKSDIEPTLNNFTKPRKSINKRVFDLNTQINEFMEFVRPALWIDGNEKFAEKVFDCKLAIDKFETSDQYLTGAEITGYEIVDQNTIKLKLKGKTQEWYYDVDARKATSFTMITDLVGLLLIISPDGAYKIVGHSLEKKLNLI